MTTGRATILMYHRVGDLPVGRPEEDVYRITPDVFEAQMRFLARSRLPVVAASALEDCSVPPRAVVLTFDDGCDSDVTVALPILRRHGFPASFFVSPGLVGQRTYLSWEGVSALAAAGMEVGTHGLDHTLLGEVPTSEAERQLRESRAELERHLKRPVDAASLPGGSGGRRVARLALGMGYRRVMGSHPGVARGGADRFLPRFALRGADPETVFTALVEQARSARVRCLLRYGALNSARLLLGNARYEEMKSRLLAHRRRLARRARARA